MSGEWTLDGIPFSNFVEKHHAEAKASLASTIIYDRTPLRGGVEIATREGARKQRRVLSFWFAGDGHEDAGDYLVSVVENQDVWTLQAPLGMYVLENARRAAFSSLSATPVDSPYATTVVRVQALVEGIWVADGGSYCHNIRGDFKRTQNMLYVNQDGEGKSAPLVTLREQHPGYPVGYNVAMDTADDTPPIAGTIVAPDAYGFLRTWQTFDVTDFLRPGPPAIGASAVWELCEVPALSELDGDESDPPQRGGIASISVAKDAISLHH